MGTDGMGHRHGRNGVMEMANVCSEYRVRGCPASHYLNGQAFALGRNCWEVRQKPCCSVTDESECVDCAIHKCGKAELGDDQGT